MSARSRAFPWWGPRARYSVAEQLREEEDAARHFSEMIRGFGLDGQWRQDPWAIIVAIDDISKEIDERFK